KSNIPGPDKRELLDTFEEVLGIGINREVTRKVKDIPKEVLSLIEERNKLRKAKEWEKADIIRKEIEEKGWKVEDRGEKTIVI
ncbi:MAG: cysteine--tRNA ligase, partial [bacterium]